jgi:hypothetical protein
MDWLRCPHDWQNIDHHALRQPGRLIREAWSRAHRVRTERCPLCGEMRETERG